jgi:hypothetical protein
VTGLWVSTSAAALRVGRSSRRVRRLAELGLVEARESSEGYQVWLPSVVAYVGAAKPGRPRHADAKVASNGSVCENVFH